VKVSALAVMVRETVGKTMIVDMGGVVLCIWRPSGSVNCAGYL
jgi:hypothetical protein